MWIKRLRIILLILGSISFVLLGQPKIIMAGTGDVVPQTEATVQLIEPKKITSSLPKLGATTLDVFVWLGVILCVFTYWKFLIGLRNQRTLK